MHDPKYLLELKSRAEKALNSEPPDGLSGFTQALTFWEAVQRRILILACKREGWTVRQASDSLPEKIIDQNLFLRLYDGITSGRKWEESLPFPAENIWPAVSRTANLKKRIIQGTSRIGDPALQAAAWKILRFVDLLRDHPLGDPLKELPKRARKTRTDESLREILNHGDQLLY